MKVRRENAFREPARSFESWKIQIFKEIGRKDWGIRLDGGSGKQIMKDPYANELGFYSQAEGIHWQVLTWRTTWSGMSFQMLHWYLVWEKAENWRPGIWLTSSSNDRGKVNLELGVGDGSGGEGYRHWRAEGIWWGPRADIRLDCTQALGLANW